MYGRRWRGADGYSYDSKAELDVARHLEELILEKVVMAYMPHPVISGLNADFLVQLGPAAGDSAEGQLVLVEYDGLGEERKQSLAHKIHRYADLAIYGIQIRWLVDHSYEGVAQMLIDYKPPHFISKVITCPECGESKINRVIAHKPKNMKVSEIQILEPCSNHTNDDGR